MNTETTTATTALSIIESTDISQVQGTLSKITEFQKLVNEHLKKDTDYGVIPGTAKPTLLKPGAEKLLMLMGLTSEFDILDSTRDFEEGFFQYQVKCQLFKNGVLLTEGLGSANTKESKYRKQNAYTIDNTILKMAKKRALVDAALIVGSLSQIFTQDMEDLKDLQGDTPPSKQPANLQPQSAPQPTNGTISEAQGKRMYAISKGDADLCKEAIGMFGYENSKEVMKHDYDEICKYIEARASVVSEREEDYPLVED